MGLGAGTEMASSSPAGVVHFPQGRPPTHSHGELPPGRASLQPCGRLSPGLVVHRHPLRLETEGRAGVLGSGAAGQRGPLPSRPLQTPLQGLAPPPARWRSRAHTQSTCRPRTPAHALGEARSRMCDPENGNLRFNGVRGSRATPPLPDAATAPPRAPPGPAVPRLTPRRRELSGQSVETPRS